MKGLHNNIVYSITPSGSSSQVNVYCEVSSNDGGWLVSIILCISTTTIITTTIIVIIIIANMATVKLGYSGIDFHPYHLTTAYTYSRNTCTGMG